MAITTRSGKGSALTHSEMDANLTAITEKTSATGSVKGSSGTTAQRPATPVEGYTRFNTDLNRQETYNGSAWINAISAVNTDTSDMSFVIDEDTMTSDLSTKVPTQQSVKAYVDSQIQSKDAISELSGTLDDVTDGSTYVKSTNDYSDAEKTKLGNIETAATADQTNTEIKTAYEANTDTNEFSDAEQTKLSGIESNATEDQTNAEIKTAYEANSNTNVYTDTEKSKLAGVESGADITDTANVASSGAVMESDTTTASMSFVIDQDDMVADSNTKIPTQQSVKAYVDSQVQSKDSLSELSGNLDDITDGTTYKKYSATEKTKLSDIEASADVTDTANVVSALTAGTNVAIAGDGTISSTDTNTVYTHPANHAISVITGLQTALDAKTTESYVDTQITNIIGAAPAALDTLAEIGDALNDDADFAGTMTTALAGKVDDSQVLTNVPSGAVFTDTNTVYDDTAIQAEVDLNTAKTGITSAQASAITAALPKAGGTMTGNIVLGSNTIDGLDINVTATSNLGLGTGAVDAITTGDYNVGVGVSALTAVTTGEKNVGIGDTALSSTTAGNYNTASGFQSMRYNTLGGRNTATGTWSLYSSTTGVHNTATGVSALQNNTTAAYNTAIGSAAMLSNTTGANNTASGYQSLFQNTTGANNTASGYHSLYNNTTGNYNTATGMSSLNLNTTGAYNTATGMYALKTNTTASYNTANGMYSLFLNTTGANNTATGYNALYSNTTASNNTAFGYESLKANTTGSYNVAVGYLSLYSNTTGVNNNAFGASALRSNIIGVENVAIGNSALYTNTGSWNTATGMYALYSNTTGNKNVSSGTQSMFLNTTGARNTASGYQSLYSNTTGGYNIAIGAEALFSNTTASYNIAVGRQAGYNISTGKANTVLGSQTYTGSYSPVFDIATENNRFVAGSTAVTNAYVKVAWTVTSDQRDKADITNFTHGLNYINQLRPVNFVWDERSEYVNGVSDGTKKKDKVQLGFLAQEIQATEDSLGIVNDCVVDKEQPEALKVTETKLIPILVNAIQELTARIEVLETT